MAAVPEVFNQPGAAFVLLRPGEKFPPIEKKWQKHPHSYEEACQHNGNVGVMAGGYIGLDQDDPAAFAGLTLPATTTWQTRPGRYGMWFKVSDGVAAALEAIDKKPDQAQLKLYKNGRPCGEVKLQRTYQVIPPSWKKLEDGSRADYVLVDGRPPATISLADLLAILQAGGISFNSRLDQNAAKLEALGKEQQQKRVAAAVAEQKGIPERLPTAGRGANPPGARERAYCEAALRRELDELSTAKEGERNIRLNDAAFALGQLVAPGQLSEAEVAGALRATAGQIGLPAEEAEKTIQSGITSGMAHPREIPKISRVTPDSPAGAIGVAPDGRVRQVKEHEGNKTLAWISDCALYIKVETRAKEATEFVFCGKGAVDGREVTFTLSAADAADNRKFRAALVNAFGAKNKVGKLNFETVQSLSTNPKLIKRVEVPAWEGSTPYLPGLGGEDVEFRLSPKIPAEVYDGDLQAAKEVLRKLLRVHRYAPILVATIFGARPSPDGTGRIDLAWGYGD